MVKGNKHAIDEKISRLKSGGSLRVLDLFAGCGGFSLGLMAAGGEIVAAIENDPDAARSHGVNFHFGAEKHLKPRDITITKPAQLTKELGLGPVALAFDIIIGGPPCQAFARVGRSKLREVAEHPDAFRHDPRAKLYIDYLDYVTDCAPLAVIMENVPDILNHGGHNIAEEICEVLDAKGYKVAYTLLNAAFYGVPQTRERMFMIAYLKEIAGSISFPKPSHIIDLPSGYEGSRAVALKMILDKGKDGDSFHYQEAPIPEPDLPEAVCAKDAMGDLPVIDARHLLETGALKRGARRFDQPMMYLKQENPSDYVRMMREWPDMHGPAAIKDHVIRYLPRDYQLFARMEQGDQYPELCELAEQMFQEKLIELRLAGEQIRPESKRWKEIRASIVPPYANNKFPNKWRKMEEDRPARTLLAHLGKDGYSHIHYDSAQARTISVREAARLQSFPDGFVFCGTMNPAFRQIGNAVPPLMAKAVGEVVINTLRTLYVQEVSDRKVAGVTRK